MLSSNLQRYSTLSHSFCISYMAAGLRMSGLMDSACPSLMYAGPRDVTISRNSRARATSPQPCYKTPTYSCSHMCACCLRLLPCACRYKCGHNIKALAYFASTDAHILTMPLPQEDRATWVQKHVHGCPVHLCEVGLLKYGDTPCALTAGACLLWAGFSTQGATWFLTHT